MRDGFDDVASASFTFSADHGCAFGNAPKGFPEVTAATDEGYFERRFVDMVLVVSRCEDFGFVDVVDADCLKDLQSSSRERMVLYLK